MNLNNPINIKYIYSNCAVYTDPFYYPSWLNKANIVWPLFKLWIKHTVQLTGFFFLRVTVCEQY